MKDGLLQRAEGSWSIVVDLGYVTDATGLRKRKQKWVTFHGTRSEARKKRDELRRDANRGEFIESTKLTLGEWLTEWLDKAVKPPCRTQRTYVTYKGVIETHIKPALGALRLQALKPIDLERYYGSLTGLAPATVRLHHATLSAALKAAERSGLVYRNVATIAGNRPRVPQTHEDVTAHVWEAHEARRFLETAKTAGPQKAAFYALALDSGARKSELAGLKWTDLDLQRGRLTIQRQLLDGGEFGSTKTGKARTIELGVETLALLKAHKVHQAELKLRNRTVYHDGGLLFAREWDEDIGRHRLGLPIAVKGLSRGFDRLAKTAGVRRIKIHGLRHKCATLLLSAGVPANVVQHRLGHSNVAMTLGIYSHALPSMQQDAAARLGALLHNRM
jgi:integrase